MSADQTLGEYVLRSEQSFVESPETIFAFFASPKHLADITPAWLSFRILAPSPEKIDQGTRIHYQIRLRGVPMRWTTQIMHWEPPVCFVDTQLKGPYRQWIHEHRLEVEEDLTVMRDTVRFVSAGPKLLVPAVHRSFVNPQVRSIFQYRQQRFSELFDSPSCGPVTIERASEQ